MMPGDADGVGGTAAALAPGDAAATVALLAGQEAPGMSQEVRSFPVSIRDAQPVTRELVENGIADLAAIMEPGLSALIAAHARGAHPQAAATALWQEFLSARDALMALAASHTPRTSLRST